MKYRMITVAAALMAVTAGARADIVFTPGPSSAGGLENILFNAPGLPSSGTTVQGNSNQTGFLVDFTSSSVLNTPSSGQARISGAAGTYNDLLIRLTDPAATFTALTLNIQASANGSVVFTGVDDGGLTWNSGSLALSGNGQNFFRIEAVNQQSIRSLSYVSTVGIDDTRQVRIGGYGVASASAIPEPGSMALLAVAGLPLLGLRRRK